MNGLFFRWTNNRIIVADMRTRRGRSERANRSRQMTLKKNLGLLGSETTPHASHCGFQGQK